MKTTLMHMTMSFLMTLIMTMMVITVSVKSIIDMQKSTPFECGFNPISYKRLPFSIHFFIIGVIFLVFDIEIIIIMPMIMTTKYTFTLKWMTTTMLFIIIIMLGLYYEWMTGMLKWTD